MRLKLLLITSLNLFIFLVIPGLILATSRLLPSVTAPIPVNHLDNYISYPDSVKKIISIGYSLSKQNITYLYGSSNPSNKGMDCSGTIYYLLTQAGLKNVPRDARSLFLWVKEKGQLHIVSRNSFDSSEFSQLKPGDLLFWVGTYPVHLDPPISHVMIYLGKNQQGLPLMFGASDGRSYEGKRMRGVSVFDFKLPNGASPSKFIGYSCIPEISC